MSLRRFLLPLAVVPLLLAQNGGRRVVEYEGDWFRLRGISDPTK